MKLNRMKLSRSNNPTFTKDHIAITHIGDKCDKWIRIGYTGLRGNKLNIIGVDIL